MSVFILINVLWFLFGFLVVTNMDMPRKKCLKTWLMFLGLGPVGWAVGCYHCSKRDRK